MILSGQAVALQIQQEVRKRIVTQGATPGLAVVLIGDHSSSLTYVSTKRKVCASVGIRSFFHHLPLTTSEEELLYLIQKFNGDPMVNGILVQLPLPSHIDPKKIFMAIDPAKDVDGFHPINMGKLLLGYPEGFVPCTPLGIKTLLERSQISVEGQHVVIVGRSTIVGKPLAALWMQNAPGCNATVTVVHSKTPDLSSFTLKADILVAAIGSAHFIKADMVKEGVVVVDVGINRQEDTHSPQGYRIVGDVDYPAVFEKCRAITPVPGGVGPMTVAMLLHNTWLSYAKG
jgi:methylenetetrahydrofolate dehydrogenase (NADP+) / methenyltetrahydrofolate cyclohydrolase